MAIETPSEHVLRLIRYLNRLEDCIRTGCLMVEHAGDCLAQAGVRPSLPESREITEIARDWLAVRGSTSGCDKAVEQANMLAEKVAKEIIRVADGSWSHFLAAQNLAHMLRESMSGLKILPVQRLDWIAKSCHDAVAYAHPDIRWSRARETEALWQVECLEEALGFRQYETGGRLRNSLLTA